MKMRLSVVVPTLNARETLAGCLEALAEHAPDVEVIVVNGPSSDGTTGMVRDRDDVAVLVELADREINAARNAGIDRAQGDAVAFVDHRLAVGPDWTEATVEGLAESDAVTGPTRPQVDTTFAEPERRTVAGREVSYLNPGNAAVRTAVLDELDGFDESMVVGGMRDFAHRLAGTEHGVSWTPTMQTRPEVEADGGERERDWGEKYRSLAYRLVKNYGVRPGVVGRLVGHAGRDAYTQLRRALRGESEPSRWFADGRAVVRGLAGGIATGVRSRRRDTSPRRNPRGRSARADRAVTVYDWR